PPRTVIDYEAPPQPGLEHHILLLEGRLAVTIEGRPHGLEPGDALRYRLYGASRFAAPASASSFPSSSPMPAPSGAARSSPRSSAAPPSSSSPASTARPSARCSS